MIWLPRKRLGVIVGVFITLTITGIGAYLLTVALSQPFGATLLITGPLLLLVVAVWCVFVYRLLGLMTLTYQLDRSQLIIRDAYTQTVVPLTSINRVVSSDLLPPVKTYHGYEWPGYQHGRIILADGSQISVNSTEQFERQVIIMTPQGAFGISPENESEFITQIRLMLAEGATRVVFERIEKARLVALPIWKDRLVWVIIGLSMFINLVLWGYIAIQYNSLADRLPLQFDPRGRIELVGPKVGLLVVPFIGTITLVTNSFLSIVVHRRERFAVSLLLGVSILVQVICWVATLRILA